MIVNKKKNDERVVKKTPRQKYFLLGQQPKKKPHRQFIDNKFVPFVPLLGEKHNFLLDNRV